MKKILFLSYGYPEGIFGPSTMCSVRIMRELVLSEKYEVHCISYDVGDGFKYQEVPGIILHKIPLKPDMKKRSKEAIHFRQVLMLPFYPFRFIIRDIKHLYCVKKVIRGIKFDLVIAQYYPEESLLVGYWLKKKGYINNLMLLFWDNVYGLIPRRLLPERVALRKQRRVENNIAKYADLMVSLYPLRSFHMEKGEVPAAMGKRCYLGIPSITKPIELGASPYSFLLEKGKINIVYSGTIYKSGFVDYFIDLLNCGAQVSDVNLIFFMRSLPKKYFEQIGKRFKGSIKTSDWIPLSDLLALYPYVDFFVSFSGASTAISSKVYEYMSYGKPIILLYEDDADVNVATFSKYPYCLTVDYRKKVEDNAIIVEDFLSYSMGKSVSFSEVEKLFRNDTASAYERLISGYIGK